MWRYLVAISQPCCCQRGLHPWAHTHTPSGAAVRQPALSSLPLPHTHTRIARKVERGEGWGMYRVKGGFRREGVRDRVSRGKSDNRGRIWCEGAARERWIEQREGGREMVIDRKRGQNVWRETWAGCMERWRMEGETWGERKSRAVERCNTVREG